MSNAITSDCKYFSAIIQLNFLMSRGEQYHLVPGFVHYSNNDLEILGLYREEVSFMGMFYLHGYKACDLERVYLDLKADEVSANQRQDIRRL